MPDTDQRPGPVVLIVRDGWGRNPNPSHDHFNAIKLASTPVADSLLRRYPWTLIRTSGEDVGLPAGTMGNSEVGHQNLGAGRVVDQESVRITKAIRDGSFYDNAILTESVARSRERGGAVHLIGIASDAGVHGLLTHMYACLEICLRSGQGNVWLHLLTDGRDTGPFTGLSYVQQVSNECGRLGVGQVASICGRYYAMDRDNRWERTRRAYDLLVGRGEESLQFGSAVDAVQDYYDRPSNSSQQGDEFITPRVVGSDAEASRIRSGDTVIFTNYRGDRPRQLTRAFVMEPFLGAVPPSPESGARGFDRGPKLEIQWVTMTGYEKALEPLVSIAFPKLPKMPDIAGSYLADLGLSQFRCAETEKFPHVTFFFNDYRDEPFAGERRFVAQSPQIATYDLAPEMSAQEVCGAVLDRLAADDCESFILVNFANTDMVGHTGKLDAAIRAAEVVDSYVGEIVEATLQRCGSLIVTADHGNAEQMWNPESNSPHTAHTTFDVECILVAARLEEWATGDPDVMSPRLRRDGRLADVLPTALSFLAIDQPATMTGRSLIRNSN